MAAMTTVGYLLLIGALLRYRPEVTDLSLDLTRCGATAVALFWFAFVGGYVSRLRKQLAASNARLEDAMQGVRQQTDTDELTGAYNRRYLTQMLDREQSRCQRSGGTFCVCLADIDSFKRINDTFRHHGGRPGTDLRHARGQGVAPRDGLFRALRG